jgi:hypothetical protein
MVWRRPSQPGDEGAKPMADDGIRVSGLTKLYKSVRAVDDLSLTPGRAG